MALTPRLRELALTANVTASVGWLGAVIAFLTLSVTGLTSQDPQTVRGAYLVMEPTAWAVLVPLSLASLDPHLPGRRRGGDALAQSWASRAAGPVANAARRRPPIHIRRLASRR